MGVCARIALLQGGEGHRPPPHAHLVEEHGGGDEPSEERRLEHSVFQVEQQETEEQHRAEKVERDPLRGARGTGRGRRKVGVEGEGRRVLLGHTHTCGA